MKRGNPRPLTPDLQAELDALAVVPDSEIDTAEMPPITDWSKAVRGGLYRPLKRPLSLRVDADVLAWFKRQGQGYQTRMNAALREYAERQSELPHEETPAEKIRSKLKDLGINEQDVANAIAYFRKIS